MAKFSGSASSHFLTIIFVLFQRAHISLAVWLAQLCVASLAFVIYPVCAFLGAGRRIHFL